MSVEGMIKDYQSGLSFRRVGRRHGCSAMSVYRALRREGVKVRTKSEAATISLPHEEISRAYRRGAKSIDMARQYGVSQTTILRSLWRTNTPMREPGPVSQ